jgi:UDP-glucose 4-epimerase
MKVLITGGAGFIGSHLAERLLAEGADVLILDDLSTGSMANIDHLIGRDGFSHRIGSVIDAPLVAELVDRCDVAVHLAAAVGVRLIIEQPVRTIETNVHGTEVVLGAVAKKQKKILIASTSEVYGKSSKLPFSEDDDLVLGATVNSRWAYACSKALDEWLALAYARERKVPVIIGSSTRWDLGKRDGTAWCCPPSPTRRCWASPSRCTARASRAAASCMCRIPWKRC